MNFRQKFLENSMTENSRRNSRRISGGILVKFQVNFLENSRHNFFIFPGEFLGKFPEDFLENFSRDSF